MAEQKHIAIIGAGVIGAGWAARFLLNGWDVAVFDPSDAARGNLAAMLENARRALPGLGNVALPPEGRLTWASSLAEAVQDAAWVQESLPERLELKQQVWAEIMAHAPAAAVLGSSTSGFRPSQMEADLPQKGRLLVAHPFNPVYLLPLVELVGAEPEPAAAILRAIGMSPLILRKEIDAHVADRLLEAVWREALWLIRDGVVTTQELDDAIRLGFGLRWAQMGLFETYRIAGGAAGMRHFLAQFGPALKWPWSRLTDVPDMDDALVQQIAAQSDAQSGHLGIRDLERIRDDNLVAMLRALAAKDWGAGQGVRARDETLRAAQGLARRFTPEMDLAQPLLTAARVVPQDWADYNGHMTESRYLEAFADATDLLLERLGVTGAYLAEGGSFFTVETHIRHLAEVHVSARIEIRTQVLGAKGKKLHLWHEMRSDGRLCATGEHLLLHMDLNARRSAPPKSPVAEILARVARAQSRLPAPDGVGRAVSAPGWEER